MDLYIFPMSMACRAVQLTAKALGLELNKIVLDLMAGEHLQEDFIAINPQHCVPTLVDEDLTLCESRAICQYLVNQHSEDDDSLYPKDPKVRAKVDMLLFFDMGTLYHRFAKYTYPVIMQGASPDEETEKKVHEALGWLEGMLGQGHEYAVGDHITIADFVLVATVSTIQETGIDISEFEHVSAWLERCQENMEGYEEENAEGAKMFAHAFKSKLEHDH